MKHDEADTRKGAHDILCEKASYLLHDLYDCIFISNTHSCVNLTKLLNFSKPYFLHL